jgi:hypothetical protein
MYLLDYLILVITIIHFHLFDFRNHTHFHYLNKSDFLNHVIILIEN